MTQTVLAPQSKPPRIAFSIFSASIRAMMSRATKVLPDAPGLRPVGKQGDGAAAAPGAAYGLKL
jgi:hypothetical protein